MKRRRAALRVRGMGELVLHDAHACARERVGVQVAARAAEAGEQRRRRPPRGRCSGSARRARPRPSSSELLHQRRADAEAPRAGTRARPGRGRPGAPSAPRRASCSCGGVGAEEAGLAVGVAQGREVAADHHFERRRRRLSTCLSMMRSFCERCTTGTVSQRASPFDADHGAVLVVAALELHVVEQRRTGRPAPCGAGSRARAGNAAGEWRRSWAAVTQAYTGRPATLTNRHPCAPLGAGRRRAAVRTRA